MLSDLKVSSFPPLQQSIPPIIESVLKVAVFQSVWAPRYFNSLYIHLALYGAFIIIILAMRFVLSSRNKSRDRALEAQGKENQHQMAFSDLTDRQNVEFRYSY